MSAASRVARSGCDSGSVDIEARVALDHPVFVAPDDPDATIWRYMDFTRLVSLLDTSQLFFARADTLNDPFEGSTTQFNVRMRPQVYGEDYAHFPDVAPLREAERLSTFISCWNLSEQESAALWGLYVPPNGGVALRSSYQKLTECFG